MKPEPTGQKLKRLRRERGLNQMNVAVELEISRSHLANIEIGKDQAGRDVLIRASRFFEVTLDWLAQEDCGDSVDRAQPKTAKEARLLAIYRSLPDQEGELLLALLEARHRGQ